MEDGVDGRCQVVSTGKRHPDNRRLESRPYSKIPNASKNSQRVLEDLADYKTTALLT